MKTLIRLKSACHRTQLNKYLRPQQTFSFASFDDLRNDAPFALQKIGFPGSVGMVNSNWGFYGQDTWKVARNLTLSAGLTLRLQHRLERT
jgi:hypothetical protein